MPEMLSRARIRTRSARGPAAPAESRPRMLASSTRGRVIEETGATEEPCTLADLQGAQEAFIASTVREVMPIASIDDLKLPAAPGPVTLQARDALAQRIRRDLGV